MLVKFLSFSATVLGTKRYKAILLSCLALFFSLAGLTSFALNRGGDPSSGPAAAVSDSSDTQETDTPKLNGVRQQRATEEQAAQPPAQQTQNTTTENTTPTPEATSTTPVGYDFTVTPDKTQLSKDGTAVITVTPTDTSKVSWASSVKENTQSREDENPDSIALQLSTQETAEGLKVTAKVSKEAKPGKYIVNITAKDAVRAIHLTKSVIIEIL